MKNLLLVFLIYPIFSFAEESSKTEFFVDTNESIKESDLPKFKNTNLKLNTLSEESNEEKKFRASLLNQLQREHVLETILKTKITKSFDYMSFDIMTMDLRKKDLKTVQKKFPQFNIEQLREFKSYILNEVKNG